MAEDEMLFECPECGYRAHLYGFDVCGAEDGELACPQCNLIDPMIELSAPPSVPSVRSCSIPTAGGIAVDQSRAR